MQLHTYPNPFIESIKINYTIPETSNVRMVLTDITGQEINILFNEFKNKGIYEFDFDEKNLSMGVYILRLETGSKIQFAKITKSN
ncbi:MAG: T9SS type A sorting domain-containing protein [Bacteroidetes bacterium]|nr:T9SS type A sorting domain-containing protein [Bacteroidota bacterium]